MVRAEKDISQEELASLVGVTRQTTNSIETDQYCPSALLALVILSAAAPTLYQVVKQVLVRKWLWWAGAIIVSSVILSAMLVFLLYSILLENVIRQFSPA